MSLQRYGKQKRKGAENYDNSSHLINPRVCLRHPAISPLASIITLFIQNKTCSRQYRTFSFPEQAKQGDGL